MATYGPLRYAVLLGVLIVASCGGSEPLAPPTATTITLSTASLTFDLLGATQQLTATVRDQSGSVMSGALVLWTSSNGDIVTVAGSGLVTAIGNGSATITASSGAARSMAGVSVNDPDPDRDGILSIVDDCPTEPETVNSWLDEDGCPDETTELYEFARTDIEAYWQAVFAASSLSYDPILAFGGYDAPFDYACGSTVLNNASYCVVDFSVYYHRSFMDGYLTRVGDMAPAFIVSHEIGHHVTFLLRYFNFAWSTLFPDIPHFDISDKQTELMADCFGGAWVANADQRGLLDEGDGEEVVNTLIEIGDQNIPWFSSEGHGTAEQRVLAFLIGIVDGPSGCIDPDFFVAFPVDGQVEPSVPPPNPLRSRQPEGNQLVPG